MPRPIDDLIYVTRDGDDYIAWFDDLDWVRWPAEHRGWERRHPCSQRDADDCEELPPLLARLALALSGVPDE